MPGFLSLFKKQLTPRVLWCSLHTELPREAKLTYRFTWGWEEGLTVPSVGPVSFTPFCIQRVPNVYQPKQSSGSGQLVGHRSCRMTTAYRDSPAGDCTPTMWHLFSYFCLGFLELVLMPPLYALANDSVLRMQWCSLQLWTGAASEVIDILVYISFPLGKRTALQKQTKCLFVIS